MEFFEWNGNAVTVTGGQAFTNKVSLVITSKTQLVLETAIQVFPKAQ